MDVWNLIRNIGDNFGALTKYTWLGSLLTQAQEGYKVSTKYLAS